MIIIIDNDNRYILPLKEYLNGKYDYTIVENPDHLCNAVHSHHPDTIIANAKALDASQHGWFYLFLIRASIEKLVLIADSDRIPEIKTLSAKSVSVMEPPISSKKLSRIFSTSQNAKEKQMLSKPREKSKNLSRLRDHLFSNLLDGHNLPKDIDGTMKFLGLISESNRYYLAFVISFASMSSDAVREDIWEMALKVQEIVREEITKIAVNRSCVRDANRVAFLLLMHAPGEPFRYELEKVLEKTEKRIANECSLKITVGVGLAYNTIGDITNSYHQACDALDQGNFFGNSFVCFFCDLYVGDSQRFQLSRNVKEKITQYLYQEKFDDIDCLIEKEFVNIIQSGLATKDNILALKIDLTVFLMDLFNKLSVVSEKPKIYSNLLNDFLRADNLPTLEIIIKEKLRELSNVSHYILEEKTGRFIQDARAIVLEQISEPLNVQLIAQRLRISPNYLSAIFKAETGVRLSEYITNVKMREAARLLRESEKHITEITSLVGYDNANYFSRLFKKQYGVTPSEYRHNSEYY